MALKPMKLPFDRGVSRFFHLKFRARRHFQSLWPKTAENGGSKWPIFLEL